MAPLDSFDRIVAGIEIDTDTIRLEEAVAHIGKILLGVLDRTDNSDDPELMYLLTAAFYGSKIVGCDPTDFLSEEARGRIYAELKAREIE